MSFEREILLGMVNQENLLIFWIYDFMEMS